MGLSEAGVISCCYRGKNTLGDPNVAVSFIPPDNLPPHKIFHFQICVNFSENCSQYFNTAGFAHDKLLIDNHRIFFTACDSTPLAFHQVVV